MATGEVKKLRIIGYRDHERTDLIDTYIALINPETFKLAYAVEYNDDQASGTTNTELKFKKQTPPTLNVQLLFDGTGVFPGTRLNKAPKSNKEEKTVAESGVADEIDKFKNIVYKYNGESHEPHYLRIIWGTLRFDGVIQTIDYDYKLFEPSGLPLRVVANAKFAGSIEENLRAAFENKTSPDLTHIRQVKEGDTLPLMCQNIYGDSKYYLEVAKANSITNFRKLTPGQQVNFPPIEKLSE